MMANAINGATPMITTRPIDRVLDALHYAGARDGHEFMCHCPAHEDGKASLSVTEGDDHRALLHCQAGCDTANILAAVGLRFADLFPPKEPKATPRRAKREIVATYDYTDDAGNVLYQAVRFEPKEFRQRQPGADGEWVWNLQGITRVLYALPRLRQTPADQWVYVVEGEKDADALNGRGLTATTAAMGAGKWRAEYNEPLRDRRVCILPDNDEPGRKHAEEVARHLAGIAAQVKIIELPNLPPKGDVSDWLAMGHPAAELAALADAAPSAPANDKAQGDEQTEAMLIGHPTHDHGNAQVTDALNRGLFAYCNELGWIRHTGTHWDAQNAEFDVNRAITDTLIRRRVAAVAAQREDIVKGTAPNEARKNAVKGMYRDIVAVRLGEFDNDPDVLNCANGVIDLRTGQLVAHGPSNRFTYCVQTPYTPTANRDPWLNFTADAVGDYRDVADWYQMLWGYSLTGRTNEEIMIYLRGPARSGKGTTTQVALTLLGSPLARGVDFNTFTKAREGDSQNFDLAPLRPARFISASESGRYTALNEAVVKNITGNDPITAAYKHRDPFTYTPQFKIWLSSNHPVKGDVDDDAFWGRIRVIEFPNSHLGHEDKQLKWRMSSAAVLPGVLAWAVEGARRWYESFPQGLVTPKAVANNTREHRAELDHIQQWLDECATLAPDGAVTVPTLYKSYETWCEENGHTPKKNAAFGRGLVSKGFEATAKRIGDKVQRAYRGLILQGTIFEG